MSNYFWLHRNVFITGATGLLGSALTKSLVEKGANVTILVRDNVPKSNLYREGTINKVAVVRGDLADYLLIERSLNEYEIETVFHLGAQTIVSTANRSPLSTFESNIKGTWNMLEAVRNSPLVKRVVIASTDKAYGAQKELPYTEETPLQGKHPYDVSKSCADLISQAYYHTYKLPLAITRCGNIYGGGDLNFSRLIPGTIRSLLLNEHPIIRSDGLYLRDYFYIADAIAAYILLAEKLDDPSLHGECFNFSINNPMTVLAMVKRIASLMESNLEPVVQNQVKGEIKSQYLSSAKAKKLLNWEAQCTLDQGLQETISWYKNFLEAKR